MLYVPHERRAAPVFTFGERETYATLTALAPLRLRLATTVGLPGALLAMLLVFPRGRWWCPLLPRDERLHTVVGTPLQPPVGADGATAARVDESHAAYVAALVALYDRYKVDYYGAAAASATLEVW